MTGDSLVVILFEFRILLFLSMFCLIMVTRGLSMFIASAFDEQFITYKIAPSTCSDQWFLMQQLLQPNSRLFYDPLQISHDSLQSLPGLDPVNQYLLSVPYDLTFLNHILYTVSCGWLLSWHPIFRVYPCAVLFPFLLLSSFPMLNMEHLVYPFISS